MLIGLYAHHHGSGHLTRARQVAAALRARGHETAILSSHPEADVVLPLDAPAPEGSRPTAHGALHWAPVGHAGHTARMAQLAQWARDRQPAAVHVDVSVEVAALLRLTGVPVTVQALPGVRRDAPHALGFQLADRILAAWPDWVPLPEHLAPHAERVRPTGGISRFAGRAAADPAPERGRDVVVLVGRGGQEGSPDHWRALGARAAERTGGRARLLGLDEWVEDPFPALRSAAMVISTAGQNAVADLAAAGARAVLLPQERPFAEQLTTTALLAREGLAAAPERPGLPPAEQWPDLLDRALALDPDWSRWQVDDAADRAARAVLEAAR